MSGHTVQFKVEGSTWAELERKARETLARFLDGASYDRLVIEAEPFVSAVGLEFPLLWQADVTASVQPA